MYLDWNATAPMRSAASAAMVAALDVTGNPSSIHAEGRVARRLVEEAREHVASLVGADPANVVFTSGGTEANGLGLNSCLSAGGDRDKLLVSAIEHPSVKAGGRFAPHQVVEIAVDGYGVLDLAALAGALATLADEGIDRPLVSIMLANNETGVIQPIAAVADMVHAAGGILHVDAVQAVGKVACDLKALDADLMTVSAHKFGGPKGIGALILRHGDIRVAPLLTGGGQERGKRAGTENVAAIAGFGAAAKAAQDALPAETSRAATLRARLEQGLKEISPNAVIFGGEAERLPNTTLFAVPRVKAEIALMALDLEGFAVSSGSACSSGKVAPSHVLAAMGVSPDLAAGAIRVSLGFSSAESDVNRFLNAWNKLLQPLSKGSYGIAA